LTWRSVSARSKRYGLEVVAWATERRDGPLVEDSLVGLLQEKEKKTTVKEEKEPGKGQGF
jgi:hypothetical protein